MKKLHKGIMVALLIIAGGMTGIAIAETQHQQAEQNKHEHFCSVVDERLIELGWVDCSNR